jgi:hydrogenase maturation protease
MSRVLVAGLGNDVRGDDAAGLLAVRALRKLGAPGIDVLEGPADTLALAAAIADHDEVVLIDAVASDADAGEVLVLDERSVAMRSRVSGHGLGAREAVELARALGSNPAVHVVGITGSAFASGTRPSTAVERASGQVARWIRDAFAAS